MKNNSKAAAKRTQVVMSEKSKIFVSTKTVTTKAGKKITVNVYKRNKNAKPLKTILHPLPPPTSLNVGEFAAKVQLPPAPKLSAFHIERNEQRAIDKEGKKNRAVLIVDGSRPFVGSIREQFTGQKRCGISNR
jgi:hypothetical protein